jgi:hypothetical protein
MQSYVSNICGKKRIKGHIPGTFRTMIPNIIQTKDKVFPQKWRKYRNTFSETDILKFVEYY